MIVDILVIDCLPQTKTTAKRAQSVIRLRYHSGIKHYLVIIHLPSWSDDLSDIIVCESCFH